MSQNEVVIKDSSQAFVEESLLSRERDISGELARSNSQLKQELLEEYDKYKNLSRAFDELYNQFADLVDNQENILDDVINYIDSDRHNDYLHSLEENKDFMDTIRMRAGLDKHRLSRPHRMSDASFGIMSGSSLLRKSVDGSQSKRTSSRAHSSDGQQLSLVDESTDSIDVKEKDSTIVPRKRMSMFQRILPRPVESEVAVVSSTVEGMPVEKESEVLLGDESFDVPGSQEEPPNVPLFEHYLVIGVPVEAALEVSNQLRQRQETLSNRLMSKLGSFLGSRRPNEASDSRTSITSRPSDLTSPKNVPRTSSMFSRLISRDLDNDTATSFGDTLDPPDQSWSSKIFKKTSSSPPVNTESQPQSSSRESLVRADSTALGSGSKNEHSTFTEPKILYRFPKDAEQPPPEVCDFCMPSGGKLRHLSGGDADTSVMEILYGQGQSQRSSRCFIFILEDKTMDLSKIHPDEEKGIDTGRTYGICVVHPRLLNPNRTVNVVDESRAFIADIEFEASVCYCFITRFPLFDFFFKVIFNIITYERIHRMELLSGNTSLLDRKAYEYVPNEVYTEVLEMLTRIHPPKFNSTLEFTIAPSVAPIIYTRSAPTGEYPEHFVNAAEWALPPLIHWLSPKILAWAIGLLMCEVKLIIIGSDPATVSCAVIGLTSLLQPLKWVSPMIPIMPLKHIDFLESPVPIVAGMVVDGDSVAPESLQSDTITPLSILQLCNDGDNVTAVLDLNARDIFVLTDYEEVLSELIFPGAEKLVEKLQKLLDDNVVKEECYVDFNTEEGRVRREVKPQYNISPEHMDTSRNVQQCIFDHIKSVANNAQSAASDILKERMEAVEQKVRENMERINRMKSNSTAAVMSPHVDELAPVQEEHEEEVNDDCEQTTETESRTTSGEREGRFKAFRLPSSEMAIENLLFGPLQNTTNSVLSSDKIASHDTEISSTDNTVPFGGNSSPARQDSSASIVSTSKTSLVSLFKFYIDTSETTMAFMRRFVSTQLYASYNQEVVDIMEQIGAVVVPDLPDERSCGRHNATAPRAIKKSRSRSMYVSGDVKLASLAETAGSLARSNVRKRSSSSAASRLSVDSTSSSLRDML